MATNNSINSLDPIQVALGGTGAATLTTHGVLLGEGTGAITALAAAATGATLMGSTGADPAFTGSPSFSGSVTAGTSITATSGDLTITAGNILLPTTSSSVGQIKINSAAVFQTFGTRNTFVGLSSGNFTLTTGSSVANTGIGANTLTGLTTGQANAALGDFTLHGLTTGSFNTATGQDVFETLLTGSRNVGIGIGSGSSYTGAESSNILINSAGVVGESNVMRLGAGTGTGSSQLNKAFISGIQGITVTGTAVLISSSDQLGIAVSSQRFKENISDMDDYSSSIMNLRPVVFNYIVGEDDSLQSGLIAEEVNEVMPNLVVFDKEGLPQTVKYHELPSLLLNELQKAVTIINDLKTRVAVLESR